MRVWIVNHYALPPHAAGGTRHYVLAKQLIELGHEVTIIAANYNHFSHSYHQTSTKMGEVDRTHDVPFLWIPTPAYHGNTLARFWNMLVFAFRLQRKKYTATLPKPDVIIGSSPHLFAAVSAKRLAKKQGVPFFLEIRDIWPDTLVDLGRFTHRHPLIKLLKRIELHLYKHATRIISLLPAAKPYLTAYGVNPAHILWLPNAIDANNVPLLPVPSIRDTVTVMYAGAHGLANDLDTAVDAAKILLHQPEASHIRLLFVGDGPAKTHLQQRVKDELVTNVALLASVSKQHIYQTLAEADIYLMLLKHSPIFRWGISPNKLFDYLLMGRPIIFGVDTPYNPVALVDAGISIPPSDAKALAAAILQLANTPVATRAAMGARGREFVLQQHNIRTLANSLEALLREVVPAKNSTF